MIYLYLAIAFYAGVIVGFLFYRWLKSKSSYSGAIYITQAPDKTVFSLELDEDPEMIAYTKEVIFRVVTTQDNSDRE